MFGIGFLSGIGSAISGSFGDIAGAIGGVASTILGNNSAKNEASKNRDWQGYMSNTSISRRMQDLRNSGLNPLLAVDNASSGASTPSGSQAQLQQFDPSWITALSSAKLQKQQGEVAKAEERKVNAEAQAQEQENNLFESKAKMLELQIQREQQGILNDRLMAEISKTENEKKKIEIYKNACEAKGININNEKAKEELSMLIFLNNKEKNKITNTDPVIGAGLDLAEKINSPWSLGGYALGSLFGSVDSAKKLFLRGMDVLEDKRKGYSNRFPSEPRKINVNRISR